MTSKKAVKKQVVNTVDTKTPNTNKKEAAGVQKAAVPKILSEAMAEIAAAVEAEDAEAVEVVEITEALPEPKTVKAKKVIETKEPPIEETKEPVKKTAASKAAEKETEPAPEAAPKKAVTTSVKESLYIQYAGREIEKQEIIENVKSAWVAAGNKLKEIKTLTLYVKPEENQVYYVINDTEKGCIGL